MKLAYVPLLRVQRGLYDLPRGKARFDAYLRVMCDERRERLRLPPLNIINPMAREPVSALLDALLALDADGHAARALRDVAAPAVADGPGGDFQVALVVADDAGGGWTNRYAWEFAHRFERPTAAQQGWLTGVLWSGDPPMATAAREAMLTAIFREAHVQQHGTARTLRERLAQEGAVLARAGCTHLALDRDEIEYTRAVIAPHLDSADRPTAICCLFGDPAARSLGYAPPGLEHWAGVALALHDAQRLECGGTTHSK